MITQMIAEITGSLMCPLSFWEVFHLFGAIIAQAVTKRVSFRPPKTKYDNLTSVLLPIPDGLNRRTPPVLFQG